jgi:hypothetical protein
MESEIVDGALVVRESLSLMRAPGQVLDEARNVARALVDVIKSKPRRVEFNGEQYLEVEDWETIGAMFGCTADIEWTRRIEFERGDRTVRGWEARAVILDRKGRQLSHAEAMCLDDEDKWSEKPKYVWAYVKRSGGVSVEDPGRDEIVWEGPEGKRKPKKQRVRDGEASIPEFQLRSMAQTRAISKVHSNVFRWVAQLGGFRGTPAEEIDLARESNGDVTDTHTGEVVTESRQQAKPAQQAKPQQQAKPAQAKAETKPAQPAQPAKDDAFDRLASGGAFEEGSQSPQGNAPAAAAQTSSAPSSAESSSTSASGGLYQVVNLKETRSGTNKRGPWTLYEVEFSNGRRAKFFSDAENGQGAGPGSLLEAVQAAGSGDHFIKAYVQESDRGFTLTRIVRG